MPQTGLWTHRGGVVEPPLSLGSISYQDGTMRYPAHRHREPETRLAGYLAEARTLLADPPPAVTDDDASPGVGSDFEQLRWFWLPAEAADELAGTQLAARAPTGG